MAKLNTRYGTSRSNCTDCKPKFNSKLENQIKLKHKKYELMNENLPLAFDLVDKCQINICTSSICSLNNYSASNSLALSNNPQASCCARCSAIFKSSSSSNKCSCCSQNANNSAASNVNNSNNSLKPLKSKSVSSSLNIAINSLQTHHLFGNIKAEPQIQSSLNENTSEEIFISHWIICYTCDDQIEKNKNKIVNLFGSLFSGGDTKFAQLEITLSSKIELLVRCASNQCMHQEIYEQFVKHVKPIIFISDVVEVEERLQSLKLLTLLCFNEKIVEQVNLDDKFCKYLTSLTSNPNTRINFMSKTIEWSLNV